MPKAKDQDSTADSEPAFEDALSQLEGLVREMESDQMPLEDLINNFEKGTRLFQVCEKRLDEARGRIEIIRKKRNEEHVLEPFGDESTAVPAGDDSDAEESQENGELF